MSFWPSPGFPLPGSEGDAKEKHVPPWALSTDSSSDAEGNITTCIGDAKNRGKAAS